MSTVWVRDGMKWLKGLLHDPALKDKWMWYPKRKYLHINGQVHQFVDEPLSGSDMWEQQDALRHDESITICMLLYYLGFRNESWFSFVVVFLSSVVPNQVTQLGFHHHRP